MALRFLAVTLRTNASLRTTRIATTQQPSVLPPLRTPSLHASRRRFYSSESSAVQAPDYLDEGERKVFDLVKEKLTPTKLEVQDVSGGCGSMYALDIVSEQFKGMPTIKQHRLVNQVLGEEIKKWHGVQLKTKAP